MGIAVYVLNIMKIDQFTYSLCGSENSSEAFSISINARASAVFGNDLSDNRTITMTRAKPERKTISIAFYSI